MTIKLPVDLNTLDDETLSLLIDESQKALDKRNKYVPFVGEIVEVWDGENPYTKTSYVRTFEGFVDGEVSASNYSRSNPTEWQHYRRLDPTRILQFRDHEPGPCPCPDEEWVHVMWDTGVIHTDRPGAFGISWENGDILRWCPAVEVE